jgi:dTDP-4-amino-4,6-dideoxygalactose transaminase
MSVNDRVRHESKKLLLEDHVEVAYNYRLTDIQASVGIRQLEKLDWIIEQRRKIAAQYSRELGDIDCLRLPSESPDCFSNFQSYSIYLKKTCRIARNDLIEKLLEDGISTRRGVMTAHRETAYSKRAVGLSLPVSEDASDQSVILPLYVGLEEGEVSFIAGKIRAHLS